MVVKEGVNFGGRGGLWRGLRTMAGRCSHCSVAMRRLVAYFDGFSVCKFWGILRVGGDFEWLGFVECC